ncbi:hypothetical protein ACLQ2Q_18540 [Microbacterium sp. DT81.1]|uniref:hypothetical protein n=1 Tax=Microbacterium sp. DT81.1 TaxID=3393413 RepID=UPI003CF232D5
MVEMHRTMSSDAFELRRVDDTRWQIENHVFGPGDPGYTVARLHEPDECHVEVEWLQPVHLQTRYATAFDALDDLIRWTEQRRGSERPTHIAHFPPTGPTVVQNGYDGRVPADGQRTSGMSGR